MDGVGGARPSRRGAAASALAGVVAALATVSAAAAGASSTPGALPQHRVSAPAAVAPASAQLGAAIARNVPRALGSASLRLPVARTYAGTPCGDTGVLCSRVEVPLDQAGDAPGTISLHVEVVPSLGPSRGTVFLIAGGPGQGSAHVFGLDTASAVSLYRYLFPGYTLVAYDDRGTGDSGALDCPGLQRSTSVDPEPGLTAECANGIGPARDFYSTRDHAADLEAVRQALGVDKVALWGTSYGTKLAYSYALAYPTHVERLLLDSVVSPSLKDPFDGVTLRAIPGALGALCAGGACRSATRDAAGDLVAVANRVAAKPVVGKVLQPNGTTRTMKLNGAAVLFLTVDADLSPSIAAALPAAAHAARLGDYRPLLRLSQLDVQSSVLPNEDLSAGLFAATNCHDGPFPWDPGTPVAARPPLVASAVSALPPGSLGPFGPWAAQMGNATFCLAWPPPAGGVDLGAGPLPDVPVLAVSGGIDMRTPTVEAQEVLSHFPQGRLLVVPGVGHSVLGADVSFCSQRAVHDWMLGNAPASSCARPSPIVGFVPAYPSATRPKRPLNPQQTLAAVRQTLADAEALVASASPGDAIAGLARGRMVAIDRGFTLVRYSLTPGIEVSGKLKVVGSGLPLTFSGTVTVGGSSAANGVLGVKANKLGGTLGGKIVRG